MVRETSPGTFPTGDNFDKLYRGQPSFEGAPKPIGIPWDIYQPQPRLMELEALGGIAGEVLDIGCGPGDNSIFLASHEYSVNGAGLLYGRDRAGPQPCGRGRSGGGLRRGRRHQPHRLRRTIRHRDRQRRAAEPVAVAVQHVKLVPRFVRGPAARLMFHTSAY